MTDTQANVRQTLRRLSDQLVSLSKELNGGELDLIRLQFMYRNLKDLEYLVLHYRSLILKESGDGDSKSTQ